MGHPENITNEKFEAAAEAMQQPVDEAKKNAGELLKKVRAAKDQSTDKNWNP
ncbi:MAG: hypothetical protein ACR2N3_18270 [Pyrinomonadaceae bacterium]